jgi:3-phenylpropionate/trans-cinnamate dioxygenase ferredoxin subunit
MGDIQYFPVSPIEEIPHGERIFISVGDIPIVIFNISGEFFAIGDVCTHDDGPLGDGEVVDHQIICPRHGARFDIRTGEVLTLPAVQDVPRFPLRVKDGTLEIGLLMD